ncbi:MAG TPA: ABC transporter permease [Candidatus Limiplasma sp.]|nr:ABC transporter permease [Candidatus Limiplasma sp.]
MQAIEKKRFTHIGESAHEREAISSYSLTYMQDAMRRLMRNKVAVVCMFVILILALFSIFAPIFSPFDYREQHYAHTNSAMGTVDTVEGTVGAIHYFGTDKLGRDLFTRIWMGGRVSLTIAIVCAIIDLIIGVIYGGVSGYFGGTTDIVMMRILEIINGIPYLIIVILLMMIMPPGMLTIIVAYSLVGWIPMARLVRGQVVALKRQEFVVAAEALGASPVRIIARHLLPNTLSVVIVRTTLSIPAVIFTEAYLSYLGLGIQLPMCSWGSLAQAGIENFRLYPYQLIIPAICISLTMLAFNLFGDGLRDAFDPRLRR